MANPTLEKSAKLTDVAKAAGVSQGTVSNVFNRPLLVREEVRDHVRAVAKSLGYRGADPKGRLLRAGKVNAIGCATVQPLSYFFDDPFARMMMSGISEICDARGAGMSLVSAANEEELVWNLRSALVDGFILFCLEEGQRLVEITRERQLPFVALALGEHDETVSAVAVDDIGGARVAAEHIAGLGHTRIAVLGLALTSRHGAGRVSLADAQRSAITTPRYRIIGYMEGLAAHGIDPEGVPIFETQATEETVDIALEQMFAAERPTAILAQSDRIALMAIDWLAARELDVPGDVSIIGFDGIREAATSRPPLTTMVQPIAEIGRRAAMTILENDGETHQIALPVELVVRDSTAPPRR